MEDLSVKELIEKGDRHLQNKEHQDACFAYLRVLNEEPRNARVLYNVGAIFLLSQRPKDALPILMTAAQIKPSNVQFSIALLKAIMDTGDTDRAASFATELAQRFPDNAQIKTQIGQMSFSKKALKKYNGFRTDAPASIIQRTLDRAAAAFQASDTQTAYRLGWDLAWQAPNQPHGWKFISGSARQEATVEQAEMAARRALALAPDDAETINNLAVILTETNRMIDALQILKWNINRLGQNEKMVVHLAEILHQLRRDSEALEAVQALLDSDAPVTATTRMAYANALEKTQRYDEARKIHETLLAENPMNEHVVASFAAFLDKEVDDSQIATLLSDARERGVAFTRPDLLDAEARTFLRLGNLDLALERIEAAIVGEATRGQLRSRMFTKGRILDKLGRHEEAFAAFVEGNALCEEVVAQREGHNFLTPLNRIRHLRDELRNGDLGETAPQLPESEPHPQIAFIIGFPRSGTTLLDTILRTHSRVEVQEEKGILNFAVSRTLDLQRGEWEGGGWIDRMRSADAAQMRKHYLEKLEELSGSPLDPNTVYIDKLPLNMNWADPLYRLFPESLFIFAIRHPFDSAISNLFQDFRPNPAMMNMTQLSRINTFYDESFSYFEEFEELRSPRVERVHYEDVVNDLENTVTRVMSELGLEFEEAQSRFFETAHDRGRINTPSYTQVSQKIYSSSKERWRNYAFAFDGDETADLRKWAIKHGYSVT